MKFLGRQSKCKLLHYSLIFIFFITHIQVHADPRYYAIDPSTITQLSPEALLKKTDQLTTEELLELEAFQEKVPELINKPAETTLEILYLLQALYKRIEHLESQIGEAELFRRVSERKSMEEVSVEVKGIGKADLKSLGYGDKAQFIIKLRHNGSRIALLLFDNSVLKLQDIEEPPSEELSEQEYKEEVRYRKYIASEMRAFIAKQVMRAKAYDSYRPISDWTPKELKNMENQVIYDRVKLQEEAEKNKEQAEQHVEAAQFEEPEVLQKQTWWKQKWAEFSVIDKGEYESPMGMDTILVSYNGSMGLEDADVIKTQHFWQLKHWKRFWSFVKKGRYKKAGGVVGKFSAMFSGIKDVEFASGQLYKKPNPGTLNWLKMYGRSIWVKPEFDRSIWEKEKGLKKLKVLLSGDIAIGLFFGTLQTVISTGVGLLTDKPIMDVAHIAEVTFIWGVGTGILNKTYQEWVYGGGRKSRYFKNFGFALGYIYHLYSRLGLELSLLTDTGKEKFLSTLGLSNTDSASLTGSSVNMEGAKNHFWALTNLLIKSWVKVHMQDIPKFRKDRGESLGHVKIPAEKELVVTLPGPNGKSMTVKLPNKKDIQMDVRKDAVEAQFAHLAGFPAKMLDVLQLEISGLPAGRLAYISMGPLAHWAFVKYLESYANKFAQVQGEHHAETVRLRRQARMAREGWEFTKLKNYRPRHQSHEDDSKGIQVLYTILSYFPIIREVPYSMDLFYRLPRFLTDVQRKAALYPMKIAAQVNARVGRWADNKKQAKQLKMSNLACGQLF